jgi:hypothetical protein
MERGDMKRRQVGTIELLEAELTLVRMMLLKALNKDFVPQEVLTRALEKYAELRDIGRK